MTVAGFKTLLGIRSEGDWVDIGTVAHVLPFLGEDITETPTLVTVPGIDALGGYNAAKLAGSHYSGPVSFGVYPYNIPLRDLLYCALGSRSGDYIYIAGQPPGMTLCIDKDSVHEYSGGKIISLILSGSADTPIVGEADTLFARKADNTATNPSSSGWAYTDLPPLMVDSLVCSINDYDGADFVSGDEVCITNFSLGYTGDFIVHHTKCSGIEISEPKRKRFGVTLSLDLESLGNFGDGVGNTSLKKIKLRTEVTVGGDTKYFEIWLPKCRLTLESEPVSGQNIAIARVEFECLVPGTVPTGFPDYDSALILHWNQ